MNTSLLSVIHALATVAASDGNPNKPLTLFGSASRLTFLPVFD
jgi:hypothetical protein